MVGLNGVVVKSHGGTDAQGFAHAVDVAMDMVTHRFNDRIREDLARIGCAARRRRTGVIALGGKDAMQLATGDGGPRSGGRATGNE